jgi:hypothetical protein
MQNIKDTVKNLISRQDESDKIKNEKVEEAIFKAVLMDELEKTSRSDHLKIMAENTNLSMCFFD